jgi:hypothetical protein
MFVLCVLRGRSLRVGFVGLCGMRLRRRCRVSEFEGLLPPGEVAERKAVEVEAAKVAAVRSRWSREQAVFVGGQLAAAESVRRGESVGDRGRRVARGRAYAGWEWDGKPAGGGHLLEFGVVGPEFPTSVREFRGPDPKGGKK